MTISYSDIPGFPNLFLDYLYEFENVEEFYLKNYRDTGDYPKLFNDLSTREKKHAEKLTEIIKKQYKDLKPSKLTRENIDALALPNTVAVVTGQQLGLFGGPLYTIYKTVTALKLCGELKDKYEDFNFVPVFWMEGDDHDFDEVRTAHILGANNEVLPLTYDDGKGEENRGSVADIKLNEGINDLLNNLDSELRDNDFKNGLMNFLKESYKEGDTFVQSFRKMMSGLFDEYGLILFDPHDVEVKRLLAPVFEHEITNYEKHTDTLVERSAALEEVYHAQVKVKPINLFIEEDKGRYSIEPADELFRLKGKRVKLTREDLLNRIRKEPEKFSPNVLLRPICQDYLFPTGFYIAGPAEVSYFAQVVPLYEYFNLAQPYVYPRASVTLLEKNLYKIFDKFDLELTDFMIEDKLLKNKVINSVTQFDIDDLFSDAEDEINRVIDRMKEKLFGVDKNLMDVAEKTRGKISGSLQGLKDKSVKAEEKAYDITLRQTDRARNNLFPDGKLQERVLSFIYFAHKHGLDVVRLIYNELSHDKDGHQVIEL